MVEFKASSILRKWLSVGTLPHKAVLRVASARQSAVGSCDLGSLGMGREVNGLHA